MGTTESSSIGKRVLALLVLLLAGWVLLKVVIGIVTSLATIIIVVAAIFAVVWAIRTF